MGWKNFKKKFNIEHDLHIYQGELLFASHMVSNLGSVNLKTGVITHHEVFNTFFRKHYPELLEATTEEVLELLNTPDVFEANLKVYTYTHEGEIEEHLCEKYDFPNCTHEGIRMYANTFFKNRDEAVLYGKRELSARLDAYISRHHQLQSEIVTMDNKIEATKLALKKLENNSN